MNGFNSFGNVGSFGMPTSFGTDEVPQKSAGFVHYSVDPARQEIEDQLIRGLMPQQLMELASHAAEKHNQGIPLTEQEQKALAAYQAYMAEQNGRPRQAAQMQTPAEDYEPAAPSMMEQAQSLLTPKNIAIGVGALVLLSALSQRK
jgi:hypothetical protein